MERKKEKTKGNNMNIRKEIDKFSIDADKPILHWLISRYPQSSTWRFIATCSMQRYGKLSYEVNRIWAPTLEGRILYKHLAETVKG